MRGQLLKAAASAALLLSVSVGALAAEGGAGAYLLGSRGQGAGITPPPGLFLNSQTYIYDGDFGRSISLGGGNIGSNVNATAIVNLPTAVWVTPADVLGGNLGFTATLPYGDVDVEARVGPFNRHADVFTIADPSASAFLGWHSGEFHYQLGVGGFFPIGDYHDGSIANIAKHRLAADVFGALTWFDPASGFDFTNIVGVTFNAENKKTNYQTGTEFHWEGSLTKKLNDNISLGVVGYHYEQLTGDSGSGARLGDFKGRVSAIGATAGLDFLMGQIPVSTRIRYYHEFDAKNRLEGNAVFLSGSMPLYVYGH